MYSNNNNDSNNSMVVVLIEAVVVVVVIAVVKKSECVRQGGSLQEGELSLSGRQNGRGRQKTRG